MKNKIILLLLLSPALFALDFNWAYPMDGKFNVDHFMEHYVCHANGRDYYGGFVTYSKHGGNDFFIYPPGEKMDSGVTILAVADGIVTWEKHDNIDDHIWHGCAGQANNIEIIHNDTLVCWYSHNRYNSNMVRAGDSVRRGQPLAYVASSGESCHPHLHFQIAAPKHADSTCWDPFDTTGNRHYWTQDYPYSGNTFAVRELKILTETGMRFPWQSSYTTSFPYTFISKRDSLKLHPPALFGLTETRLFVYFSTHYWPGSGNMTLQLLNSRDSVFYTKTYVTSTTRKLEAVDFASKVNAGQKGTWKVRLLTSDTVCQSLTFNVGDATVYGPHFSPEAGKSIHVGAGFGGPLTVDSLSGPCTFTIAKPTTAFTLRTNPMRIWSLVGAVSGQNFRNETIPVVAENGTGYTDTFRVHLVDFTKPFLGFPSSVQKRNLQNIPGANGLLLSNPYIRSSVIRISSSFNVDGRLSVYDLRGRVIRSLPFSRGQKVAWDGKDSRGVETPAGLLIFRCEMEDAVFTRKAVYLR